MPSAGLPPPQVSVYYTAEPQSDYLQDALIALVQLHLRLPPGDMLTFLTGSMLSWCCADCEAGREEIEWMMGALAEKARLFPADARPLDVRPIYAGLPWEEQRRAFDAAGPGTRKIILATNIAETSITINNVAYAASACFPQVLLTCGTA